MTMNLKRPFLATAMAVGLLAMAGCTVQPKTKLDAPMEITTKAEGSSLLDSKASPRATIRVEFEDNPELATLIENDLLARGFQRAAADQTPDVAILVQSAYRFQKPRTRRQAVSVGKLLADERMKGSLASLEERATRGNTGINLNTMMAHQQGALSTGGYMGVTVLEVIADLTGIRGGFNRALVGDERGLCVPIPAGACDKWHTYSQDMALLAKQTSQDGRSSEIRVIAEAEHERLLVLEMFVQAQQKLVSALAQ